jgi:flagellar operon protein (TIGR03826 family)
MAELANCSRCGGVFVKTVRDICENCYRQEEEAFQKVYYFLRERKNRGATVLEIVEATRVEEELIFKFVKERRLTPKDFPGLTYPCERCGEDITEGKICTTCQQELKRDLSAFEEEERRRDEWNRKEKGSIYFAIDKHKK